ncbi:2'-5' RNA ligase family protein [Candidatus Woesearchaeota archaeon]|nr:2'-5' RNA ligase family protein [Candidatus Woesearchaeota archaeon]
MAEGRYTIIILPDKNFSDLVFDIRSELVDSIVVPKVPPHVTLREDFFSDNIDGFIDEFSGLIDLFSSFNISFSHVDVFQRGHVVYLVNNHEQLQALHELTVKTSQKYVSTPKEIDFDCELNERQKELVALYQLPFYFEYYNPHMTLVRLNDNSNRELILKHIQSKQLPKMFKATAVCIYDKVKKDIYKLIPLD